MRPLIVLVLCVWLGAEANNSVNGYFDLAKDGAKFKKLFTDSLSSQDLSSIFYSVSGLKLLNQAVPNGETYCKVILDAVKSTATVEEGYYASSAVQELKCKSALPAHISALAKTTIGSSTASLYDLMYAVYTLKSTGVKDFDKATITKTLQEYLKKDDSVLNLGIVFHICSEIGCGPWAYERIEDAIVQADEVDGKMLNWEGGLPVTGLVFTGIMKLAQFEKKTTHITSEQGVKFGNYLLSRRSVQSVKGGQILLESLIRLSGNKDISPICISLQGTGQIGADSQPLNILVSDIMGGAHSGVTADSVIAQSATRLQDDVVVLSKQKLTQDPKTPISYTLDLMKVKPERGLYKLAVSSGAATGTLSIRVLGSIEIDNVEVGIGDVDGTSAPKMIAVKHPSKISQALEADSMQKIIVKFALRDKGQTQLAKLHQTFIRIFNKASKIEVIFVAEVDSLKSYKMDVDVGSVANKFDYESGSYSIEAIIGDASISNPIRWTLADIALKFPAAPVKEVKASGACREMKPEIVHMFREPDARPARIVSDVFTGLCAAPLLLLLILWGKIGINVKNFPFSLSAIGFHLGLGSIFGLFVVFWLQLTMFETLRYLLAVGFITFICGHQLLKNLAAKRKGAK